VTEAKTNRQLANELRCTPRNVSKSRRRGYIFVDGEKVQYRAPAPRRGK